mgnify:FL=1
MNIKTHAVLSHEDSNLEVQEVFGRAINKNQLTLSEIIAERCNYYSNLECVNEIKVNLNKLTKKEIEVLILICAQKSNQEIAQILKISVNTVTAHRRNIFIKTKILLPCGF